MPSLRSTGKFFYLIYKFLKRPNLPTEKGINQIDKLIINFDGEAQAGSDFTREALELKSLLRLFPLETIEELKKIL